MTARFQGDALWKSILELPLAEADVQLPFASRLAIDHQWTVGYASRVVTEYRRFLYLTQLPGPPVAPSDAVDKAWHLHLVQTYFYWEVMCRQTLGRKLHHSPTVSGTEGRDSDVSRYADTIRRYQEVFGQAPPPEIWPAPAQQFSPVALGRSAVAAQGLSPSSQWPRLWAAATLLLAMVLAWSVRPWLLVLLRDVHPLFQWLGLGVCLAACLLVVRAWGRGVEGVDLDPFEAAWLKHGKNHMVNTALVRLVDAGLAVFVTNGKTGDQGTARCTRVHTGQALPGDLDPCEAAALQALAHDNCGLNELSTRMEATCFRVKRRLQNAGLVCQDQHVSAHALLTGAVLAAFTVWGAVLAGVPHTVSLGEFLLVGTATGALFPLIGSLSALFGAPRITRDGVASLSREGLRVGPTPVWTEGAARGAVNGGLVPMRFALEGSAAVIHDKRFHGINYLDGSITSTAHSDDRAGCGDNLPKCG